MCISYHDLYFSNNNITSFDGFDGSRLKKLNLAKNQFQAAPNLSRMELLEALDLSNNQITTLDMAFLPLSIKKVGL